MIQLAGNIWISLPINKLTIFDKQACFEPTTWASLAEIITSQEKQQKSGNRENNAYLLFVRALPPAAIFYSLTNDIQKLEIFSSTEKFGLVMLTILAVAKNFRNHTETKTLRHLRSNYITSKQL